MTYYLSQNGKEDDEEVEEEEGKQWPQHGDNDDDLPWVNSSRNSYRYGLRKTMLASKKKEEE